MDFRSDVVLPSAKVLTNYGYELNDAKQLHQSPELLAFLGQRASELSISRYEGTASYTQYTRCMGEGADLKLFYMAAGVVWLDSGRNIIPVDRIVDRRIKERIGVFDNQFLVSGEKGTDLSSYFASSLPGHAPVPAPAPTPGRFPAARDDIYGVMDDQVLPSVWQAPAAPVAQAAGFRPNVDYKSPLNVWCQMNHMPLPDYTTERMAGGADHTPTFSAECCVTTRSGQSYSSTGMGATKKKAQMKAAYLVIQQVCPETLG